jgi:hypothetical protein
MYSITHILFLPLRSHLCTQKRSCRKGSGVYPLRAQNYTPQYGGITDAEVETAADVRPAAHRGYFSCGTNVGRGKAEDPLLARPRNSTETQSR